MMIINNITSHNLQSMVVLCCRYFPPNLIKNTLNYCSSRGDTPPKALFRYLIRECNKLPDGPKNHYKFMIKQSFKQHVKESDPERIKQIIERSYEDAEWVLKKYLNKKK